MALNILQRLRDNITALQCLRQIDRPTDARIHVEGRVLICISFWVAIIIARAKWYPDLIIRYKVLQCCAQRTVIWNKYHAHVVEIIYWNAIACTRINVEIRMRPKKKKKQRIVLISPYRNPVPFHSRGPICPFVCPFFRRLSSSLGCHMLYRAPLFERIKTSSLKHRSENKIRKKIRSIKITSIILYV